LGQNLFFSGGKERFCFAPESISSPQKAADSILNRKERLQRAITVLEQIGEKFFWSFFESFGERRRQKKEK
jgi:hypothetical protein